MLKRIILKPGEEERILLGHPWAYGNEIDSVLEGKEKAHLIPGECADVESSRKKYLGRAIVNPNSKITARIYSPSKEGIDKGFFKRRIREAVLRRIFFRDLSIESARLVFAEADFLPGLIIDCFTGWPLSEIESAVTRRPVTFEAAKAALGPPRFWLSAQFLVWGMDCRREMIIEALCEVVTIINAPNVKNGAINTVTAEAGNNTADTANSGAMAYPAAFIPNGAVGGIYEKSAAHVRELEGLPLREGVLQGSFPETGIVIFEGDLPFIVDLPQGQKTGFFLDQRDNHLLAGKYASLLQKETGAELRILDACSYTGGFGLHALRAAGSLIMLDVSQAALETARKNAVLHGAADRVTTVEANVFDELRNLARRKEQFDMVILDPPAFAKSRSSLEEALRGYKEINLRAIKLVRSGGIFITCSCSQALDEILFKRMVAEAAADAQCRLVQIDFRFQAQDHPVLVGYDESLYLKCGFFRVI
ncbi:class I SAM-dependent rRNA methyltransferase [Treponema sp. R80B11-R83G3]